MNKNQSPNSLQTLDSPDVGKNYLENQSQKTFRQNPLPSLPVLGKAQHTMEQPPVRRSQRIAEQLKRKRSKPFPYDKQTQARPQGPPNKKRKVNSYGRRKSHPKRAKTHRVDTQNTPEPPSTAATTIPQNTSLPPTPNRSMSKTRLSRPSLLYPPTDFTDSATTEESQDEMPPPIPTFTVTTSYAPPLQSRQTTNQLSPAVRKASTHLCLTQP